MNNEIYDKWNGIEEKLEKAKKLGESLREGEFVTGALSAAGAVLSGGILTVGSLAQDGGLALNILVCSAGLGVASYFLNKKANAKRNEIDELTDEKYALEDKINENEANEKTLAYEADRFKKIRKMSEIIDDYNENYDKTHNNDDEKTL